LKRKFILVAMPQSSAQKFLGMVHNLNAINSDTKTRVTIENIYDEPEPQGVVIKEANSGHDISERDSEIHAG